MAFSAPLGKTNEILFKGLGQKQRGPVTGAPIHPSYCPSTLYLSTTACFRRWAESLLIFWVLPGACVPFGFRQTPCFVSSSSAHPPVTLKEDYGF